MSEPNMAAYARCEGGRASSTRGCEWSVTWRIVAADWKSERCYLLIRDYSIGCLDGGCSGMGSYASVKYVVEDPLDLDWSLKATRSCLSFFAIGTEGKKLTEYHGTCSGRVPLGVVSAC